MIRGIKSRKARQFFEGKSIREFQHFADRASRRLVVLDSAETLNDLRVLESNQLDSRSGDGSDQFDTRINKQWIVSFRWSDHGPLDIDIVENKQ